MLTNLFLDMRLKYLHIQTKFAFLSLFLVLVSIFIYDFSREQYGPKFGVCIPSRKENILFMTSLRAFEIYGISGSEIDIVGLKNLSKSKSLPDPESFRSMWVGQMGRNITSVGRLRHLLISHYSDQYPNVSIELLLTKSWTSYFPR